MTHYEGPIDFECAMHGCRHDRVAALEAELAEAREGLKHCQSNVETIRSAALEEAARYIEGLGMPGAVGLRALASEES